MLIREMHGAVVDSDVFVFVVDSRLVNGEGAFRR